MKRFYCSVCKKIKRVRRYPSDVTNITAYGVTERVGSCNFHNPLFRGKSAQALDHARKSGQPVMIIKNTKVGK